MNYRHGHGSMQRGQSSTYRSWAAMKRRCDNPNHDKYQFYGGRGIGYSPEWAIFSNFLADMGERPDGMTLDRMDPDKGYSKGNCRWATDKQQAQSKCKIPADQVNLIKESRKLWVGSTRSWATKAATKFGIPANTLRRIVQDASYRKLSDGSSDGTAV